MRFKLAAGLGSPGQRGGGVPRGCPLSIVFTVALNLPWCRHLDGLRDVRPQLRDDNPQMCIQR